MAITSEDGPHQSAKSLTLDKRTAIVWNARGQSFQSTQLFKKLRPSSRRQLGELERLQIRNHSVCRFAMHWLNNDLSINPLKLLKTLARGWVSASRKAADPPNLDRSLLSRGVRLAEGTHRVEAHDELFQATDDDLCTPPPTLDLPYFIAASIRPPGGYDFGVAARHLRQLSQY